LEFSALTANDSGIQQNNSTLNSAPEQNTGPSLAPSAQLNLQMLSNHIQMLKAGAEQAPHVHDSNTAQTQAAPVYQAGPNQGANNIKLFLCHRCSI